MELLKLDCLGRTLVLEGSMAGWQQLFLDDTVVSELAATADGEGWRSHEFVLQRAEAAVASGSGAPAAPVTEIACRLETELTWQPFELRYQLHVGGQLVAQGTRNAKDVERQIPAHSVATRKPSNLLGVGALVFKLFKSAKLIKVVLAGASLAAYSWLFSFQFALSLLACLMFHEYGHMRAMQYFGMRTKGIYLIPFFGGAALTDEKINTRWQDVVISMMGPCFGLAMSLLCVLAYWITGYAFFAGLAVFNALLNLLNLLPILPLDGGHVLKSISFSMNSKIGVAVCVVAAVIGVVFSYTLGLTLYGFLLLIGCLEIFVEWRTRHHSHLLPLDRYGQIFSGVWYCLLVAALVAVIWYFAHSGDELLKLPLTILRS